MIHAVTQNDAWIGKRNDRKQNQHEQDTEKAFHKNLLSFTAEADGDIIDDDAAVILPIDERIRNLRIRQNDIRRLEGFINLSDEAEEPGALIRNKGFEIIIGIEIFNAFEGPEQGIHIREIFYHSINPRSFIFA
jgi:hypothetical protein